MSDKIKIKYGEGSVICQEAKLNATLAYSTKLGALIQKAFDKKTKKIVDFEAFGEYQKLEVDHFLKHVVAVENLKDENGEEVTLKQLKEGDVSPRLFKALKEAYKQAQNELNNGDGEGKSQDLVKQ